MNYSQATKIPKRIENETNEMLIEKQAIIDVLLDTRLWGDKYITNPFMGLSLRIVPAKFGKLVLQSSIKWKVKMVLL